MHDARLAELLLLIAVAALGVAVFERLRLPSIVGFLVIGALVGPGGLGLVEDPERVRALAELGVVLLLFEIGLELPMERVRRLWRRALAAGGLQVLVTLAVVAVAAMALGIDAGPALVLGALIAMSSTALVMRLLSDRGELDTPQGQLAVGILLFQDLCIVPFLLAVPLLAASAEGDSSAVPLALGRALLALGLLSVGARFGLPRLLDLAARTRSRELFTLLSFLVVLGSAVVAESLGLTLAVGAFIGGLALNATPYAHQIFSEIVSIRGVLLGIFFTAVGMLLDLGGAAENLEVLAAYVIGVVVLKAVIVTAVVVLVLRQGLRVGMLTGPALAQTGEFSFVLAETASGADLLDPGLRQVFIAGSVLTLGATPFLMRIAPAVANRVAAARGLLGGRGEEPEAPVVDVVIVGFGVAGRNVARVLRSREIPYAAVEANPATVQDAVARGEPVAFGDATQRTVLERLGIARAKLAVVAISDPIATRELVAIARSIAPDVEIVARTRFLLEIDALEAAGASVVVAEEYETTLELVAQTLRRFSVPETAISRFAAGMREEGYELLRAPAAVILDPWLSELLEEVGTEWVEVPDSFRREATLHQLDVRARTGVNVVAVEREGTSAANPAPDYALQPGDRLLVVGAPESVAALRALLAEP
jgi:CPA2 family monovalent cation:H+ antiporter-2